MPAPGLKPIGLGIGEPRHATPALIEEALVQALPGLSSYPATAGEPALREAFAGWLQRRYGVSVDPFTQTLPVNGSREALFALAQTLIDPTRPGATVVCPNPFYQIYEGAALLAGAQTAFANSDPARNFAADWSQIDAATWARTQLLYVCSPGNPTGAVMPLDEWRMLFELSDRHGFVIASDECYSEIYFRDEPPLGSLQAAQAAGPRRLPQPGGLHQPVQALQRAGAALRLRRRRRAAAQGLPAVPHLPRQRDEPAGAARQHRRLDRRGPRAGQPRLVPQQVRSGHAAFGRCPGCASSRRRFLPLGCGAGFGAGCRSRAGDDVAFALQLLAQYNVAVLPGSLLAREAHGHNPGAGRIRMALVAPTDDCVEAAQRIRNFTLSLRDNP